MNNTERAGNGVLTKRQLAEELAVSSRHINNLMKDGLPFLKVGSAVRFEREPVFDYLRALTMDATLDVESASQ